MHINDIPYHSNFEAIKERFNTLFSEQNGCHIWHGIIDGRGYGQHEIWAKKRYGSHRLSYVFNVGPIPDKMHICHKCDVRLCINPDHLFYGTPKDNSDDKVSKGRQHHPTGLINGRCVLTIDEVKSIYLDPRSIRDVAAGLRVSKAQVQRIKAGTQWAHVTSCLERTRR